MHMHLQIAYLRRYNFSLSWASREGREATPRSQTGNLSVAVVPDYLTPIASADSASKARVKTAAPQITAPIPAVKAASMSAPRQRQLAAIRSMRLQDMEFRP
jgi:hypothetical protein